MLWQILQKKTLELSAEFRFLDILASVITYDVSDFIEDIKDQDAIFVLDLVASPEPVPPGSVSEVQEIEGCADCPSGPQQKSFSVLLNGNRPSDHMDGQSIYRIRARTQIKDEYDDPLYLPGPFPPVSMTHIVLHQRGDYNYDHFANMADYVTWRNSLGSHTIPADGNGNGTVDEADHSVWAERYGQSVAASGGVVASVPEPSASGHLLVFVLTAAICRFASCRRLPVSQIHCVPRFS